MSARVRADTAGMRLRIVLLPLFLLAAALPAAARDVEGVVLPIREILISASLPGVIEQIHADEGDPVTAGQLLVSFESREQEIEALRLEQVLRKRKFDYEGVDRLFRENMTSETDKLEKEIELRVAELDWEQALAAVKRKRVLSPINGIVVRRHREAGEWAEPGQPLFELVDIDTVYARLLLKAEDARSLSEGGTVEMRVPLLGGEGTVTGTIDFIDPRIDASSGLMRVKILIANPGHRLRPGMRIIAQLAE